MDILTGSALFFLVHPAWVPVFYLLISLFVLFYWHKRQKGA
ncbi:putative membrane protein [Acinetobacter baumannii 1571545]|nr:putative membrane protein [Acinetobacter baumannii 1571545]